MADAKVDYNHTANVEDAFHKAKEVITPEYVAKYNVKADVNFDEAGKVISAKGKGFELKIAFFEGNAEVDITLSLLLRPVKGTILDAVKRKLEKTV